MMRKTRTISCLVSNLISFLSSRALFHER
jgi:hypothetical protein